MVKSNILFLISSYMIVCKIFLYIYIYQKSNIALQYYPILLDVKYNPTLLYVQYYPTLSNVKYYFTLPYFEYYATLLYA